MRRLRGLVWLNVLKLEKAYGEMISDRIDLQQEEAKFQRRVRGQSDYAIPAETRLINLVARHNKHHKRAQNISARIIAAGYPDYRKERP